MTAPSTARPADQARRVTASAPGKLMLLGEYAVVDGAPALVIAVDRRAGADLRPLRTSPGTRGTCRVVAPDLGVDAGCRLGPGPSVAWAPKTRNHRRLGLVTALLTQALAAGVLTERAPAFEIHLDTAAFFGPLDAKLGLGSSAALTVALSAALCSFADAQAPTLSQLVHAHRALQGGRGSGADVAAAYSGGWIDYRDGHTERPAATRLAPLPGLSWRCVWTGRATSTASYLKTIAAWRAADPDGYRHHLAALTDTATAGSAAAAAGDVAALLEAVATYGPQLDALGTAGGVDIVGAEHRELRDLAARCGVTYKPSGAGGGDVGVALATDPAALLAFGQLTQDSGYPSLDVATDPHGLVVTRERTVHHPAGREG